MHISHIFLDIREGAGKIEKVLEGEENGYGSNVISLFFRNCLARWTVCIILDRQ